MLFYFFSLFQENSFHWSLDSPLLSRPLMVTRPVSLLKLAMLRLSDLLMVWNEVWRQFVHFKPSTCIFSVGIFPPRRKWWILQHRLPPPPGPWSRLSANYWTISGLDLITMCNVMSRMWCKSHVTIIIKMRYLIIFPVGNTLRVHDDPLPMFLTSVGLQGQPCPLLTVAGLDTDYQTWWR